MKKKELTDALEQFKSGNFDALTKTFEKNMRKFAKKFIEDYKSTHDLDKDQLDKAELILKISQVLYNDTPMDKLILSDDLYDELLDVFKKFRAEPVGASGVITSIVPETKLYNPITLLSTDIEEKKEEKKELKKKEKKKSTVTSQDESVISGKISVDTEHSYPILKGTLHKAKFINDDDRDGEAVKADRPTVENFLKKSFKAVGLDKNNDSTTLLILLKYDGVSVVADVDKRIHQALTRGENDMGADVTHLFKDRIFDKAVAKKSFGLKAEAIMSKDSLSEFSKLRQYNYKNCRTAITALFGMNEPSEYTKFIKLIPLQTSLPILRSEEIMLMNEQYAEQGYELFVEVIEGNVKSLLKQIKAIVSRIIEKRNSLDFMIDGLVIEFADKEICNKLGRKNDINEYQIAYKFPDQAQETEVKDVTFNVGFTGLITPIVHYKTITFNGAEMKKTSLGSRKKFKELNLRKDDVIVVNYSNDVLCDVWKDPDNEKNQLNISPVYEFPTICPACGSELETHITGNETYCKNNECPAKGAKLLVNFANKLNIDEWGEERIQSLYKLGALKSIPDFFKVSKNDIKEADNIGKKVAKKMIEIIEELKDKPIYDWQLIGSIGIPDQSFETFKKIFNVITISELLELDMEKRVLIMSDINGIGTKTALDISDALYKRTVEIKELLDIFTVKHTKGEEPKIKIRFTGFDNIDLTKKLQDLGYDAGRGNVTKDTKLVIFSGDTEKKSKAEKLGIKTVDLSQFDIEKVDKYLK